MNDENSNKRVTLYDWLRLLATLFVVIGHSSDLKMVTDIGGVAYRLPEQVSPVYYALPFALLRKLVRIVYGFHMPLFFFLSGAVLCLKPVGKLDPFVNRKLKRLLLPYFVCGFMFMLPIKFLCNFYNVATIKQAAHAFLYGNESGHLWFLPSLFFCMITFVLLLKTLQYFKCESVWMLVFAAGALQMGYKYIPFDILGMQKGLSYISYFLLGYIFEQYLRKIDVSKIMDFIVFAVLSAMETVNIFFPFLDRLCAAIIGCAWALTLAKLCGTYLKRLENTRMWKLLIKNLFSIYLYHDPMEYIILKIAMKTNMLEFGGGYSFMFC